MNYYNEFDPKAAAWIEQLILGGHIPSGHVDRRSIADVTPQDLHGYTQCHFFAGIAGWSLALQLAGWSPNRHVWTGSCPCQPFSGAGLGLGTADPRHLWPVWFRLIQKCRPPVVFGEQVASKAALSWLDGVFADLESEGYACGAADLCAACIGEEAEGCIVRGDKASWEPVLVGSPHIRQRLCWVADTDGRDISEGWQERGREYRFVEEDGGVGGMGDAPGGEQRGMWEPDPFSRRKFETGGSGSGRVAPRGLGDPHGPGQREQRRSFPVPPEQSPSELRGDTGAWSRFDILPCADGKARRVESGTFPLAHGISGRVGLLRGYGNAIVPQKVAEFVKAYSETV